MQHFFIRKRDVSAATISVTARSNNTANQTTYTFSDQATGAANSGKVSLLGVSARAGFVGVFDISSATINGSAASPLIKSVDPNSDNLCAIYGIEDPSGTDIDFSVTFTGDAARATLITAATIGANFASLLTASDADGDTVGDATQTPNINTFDDGVVFGIAQAATSATLNISFTGLTDDTQQSNEALRTMAATAEVATGETPRTISVLFDTGVADLVLAPTSCVVSFST